MTVGQVLRAARQRIATQPMHPVRTFAANSDGVPEPYNSDTACCFCAIGAVLKSEGMKASNRFEATPEQNSLHQQVCAALDPAARSVLKDERIFFGANDDYFAVITSVNDRLGRGPTLTMFDRALAAFGEEAPGGC